MKQLLVQRIIEFGDAADEAERELGFRTIEQFRGIVEVENPKEYTAEQIVEMVYEQEGKKPMFHDKHRITALGQSAEYEGQR